MTPLWLRAARDYRRFPRRAADARPLRATSTRAPLRGFPRARVVADGADYAMDRWTDRTAQHRRRYRHHPARWGADGEGPL